MIYDIYLECQCTIE